MSTTWASLPVPLLNLEAAPITTYRITKREEFHTRIVLLVDHERCLNQTTELSLEHPAHICPLTQSNNHLMNDQPAGWTHQECQKSWWRIIRCNRLWFHDFYVSFRTVFVVRILYMTRSWWGLGGHGESITEIEVDIHRIFVEYIEKLTPGHLLVYLRMSASIELSGQ